jgi:ankyrin repeat protein
VAAQRGNLRVVSMLCEAGAQLNNVNKLGNTPVFIACQNMQTLTVQELFRYGADPNKSEGDDFSKPSYTALEFPMFRKA